MISRVAYLSMHTSPLLQPGVGDAGGMNVYIDELSRTMVAWGVRVEVFTRRHAPGLPDVVEGPGGYVVHHVDAGPAAPQPVRRLARHVGRFADQVVERLGGEGAPDIVHSHYWLSGWAGLIVKRRLGTPLANSFHTLGRIKERHRRPDEPPESLLRIAAEHDVIDGADCVVASTPFEATDLMEHYGADPARLCISPPGVDHDVFRAGPRAESRRRLGLADGPLVLYVGRIQPLKGVDVAVEAFAPVRERRADARMLMIGGPSGPNGPAEVDDLIGRIERHGLGEAVAVHPPVPHRRLPDYYRSADLLVLPSRSETFGLVAAEAQACGVPVVASRVGGLAHVVSHEESGLLVDGWDPEDHAEAVLRVLDEPGLAERLSLGAIAWADQFSWEATAKRFLELYEGAVDRAVGV